MAFIIATLLYLLFPYVISQEADNREDEQAQVEDTVGPEVRWQISVFQRESDSRGYDSV
jgi:hypothetical protein